MRTQTQNLTLLTDLYELTMMQGYFKNPTDQIVVFDIFHTVYHHQRADDFPNGFIIFSHASSPPDCANCAKVS